MNINWCLYENEHFVRKILVTILMKLYQISGWRERLKPQQLQSLTQSDLELSQQAWVLSTLCIRFCPVLFPEVFAPNFDSRLSPGRQNIGISSVFVPSFLWSEWCCKNLLCYRQNRGITQTRKISRQHETPKSFVDIRHELLACLFCSQNGFQEEQVL